MPKIIRNIYWYTIGVIESIVFLATRIDVIDGTLPDYLKRRKRKKSGK